MLRKSYPTDLTDQEWEVIAEFFTSPTGGAGRPQTVDVREVLNAIFYWADNGIKWRALPHDFPCWPTVYGYFRRWVDEGTWERVNLTLARNVRVQAGRNESPTLAIIDSQSVEMTQKGVLNKALMATRR